MTAAKHDEPIDVFNQPHSIDDVHNSRVCRCFYVGGRGEVDSHRVARTVLVIVAEQLSLCSAVCFNIAAQSVTWIHFLIHSRVVFIVQIVARLKRFT